ncbi:DUF2272 domain-containing protein [Sphingosinicella terrae]|uniref:DUF2272 domain-containing protein n=1 Tax=Sphingosinicella terrae TaxID=2172047 RepID=UPI000E0DF94C|nr:DUF2272 domain-containing protein [Sphingosinicella terrae]
MHFVDVEALNFRNAPRATPETKFGTLFLCHPVEIVEADSGDGFCRVRTRFDGAQTEGFVSRALLRESAGERREALIAQAILQWHRFERGLGKETVDPFFRHVGEMWRAIGIDLDGKDNDQPWSAAAISFMVRHAGKGYEDFRFAAAHARYIHHSIKKREADAASPFWGFRLHEHRPRLGDMVCRWRERPIDFETARRRDDYKSHCDIVIKVDSAKNVVLALGGNVRNSVSITRYALGPGDFLADQGGVFAVLANRADA